MIFHHSTLLVIFNVGKGDLKETQPLRVILPQNLSTMNETRATGTSERHESKGRGSYILPYTEIEEFAGFCRSNTPLAVEQFASTMMET